MKLKGRSLRVIQLLQNFKYPILLISHEPLCGGTRARARSISIQILENLKRATQVVPQGAAVYRKFDKNQSKSQPNRRDR